MFLSYSKKNNPGYVLYLVLIVLSILGVLASIVLFSVRSVALSAITDSKKYQARLLAESGLARAEYFLNGGDGHTMEWETDSLVEAIPSIGIINVACKRFGAYDRIVCTGKRLSTSCSITGLMGRNAPDNLKAVLTLTGSIRGLVICRPMQLRGIVVLTNDSVYQSDNSGGGPKKMHDPGIKTVNFISDSLPFPSAPLDTVFAKMKNALSSGTYDSNALQGNAVITGSRDSILRWPCVMVVGDCEFRNSAVADKIILSNGEIILGDSVTAVSCMFMAKKMTVRGGSTENCLLYSSGKMLLSGGAHDSQFFSEDSIVVGKNASFGAMTLLVSRKNIARSKSDTVPHGGIYYEEAGTFTGCALCYSDTSALKGKGFRGPSVVIADNCALTGFLITDGDIEIGDDVIEGRLWAKQVVGRKKNGEKRTNWLYARSIVALQRDMPFPLLGNAPMKIKKTILKCEY
jgi:hypothetical protein